MLARKFAGKCRNGSRTRENFPRPVAAATALARLRHAPKMRVAADALSRHSWTGQLSPSGLGIAIQSDFSIGLFDCSKLA